MSVTAPTAQWWIRTDGADTNGGGYDSGIGGAATNYCDQAAAQATFTVLTLAAGTLTDTGSLGLFTAAMIGNAVNVPGQGYYWITARTNGNVVTVTPGTGATTSFTTQPGKVGGALRHPEAFSTGSFGSITPGTTTSVVPGNIINLRASGSGSVGSPDYTQTGYVNIPSGNTTDGYISWVAYNGTPYFVGDGFMFYWSTTPIAKFTGIYFAASAANGPTNGMFRHDETGGTGFPVFINCTIDANNKAIYGLGGTANTTGNNFELFSCVLSGGGTSSLDGLYAGYTGSVLKNCKVFGWGGYGVREVLTTSCIQLSNCAIYGNHDGNVYLKSTAVMSSCVEGCTIDGSTVGDGIQIASTAAAAFTRILNNNITTNGGYGINVAAGTAAANTAAIAYEDYNNFGSGATLNVSGAYHNLTGGAHDINVDPGYNNAAGGQFTPSNTALVAAAPIGFA